MRALSLRAAANCEYALTPRCHCRCGGALHGAKRLGDAWGAVYPPPRDVFQQLQADDPHHLRTEAEQREQRKAHDARARKRRTLAKLETEARRWLQFTGNRELSPYLVARLDKLRAELANDALGIVAGAPA